MENRKSTILLTIIAVATLLVAVVGATFAYFQAQIGANAYQNVTVTTHTTDSSTFDQGQDIDLVVNQDDLSKDKVGTENNFKSASSTGKTEFTASSAAAADFCYTVTLNIDTNEFTCSPGNVASGTTENPTACTNAELQLDVTKQVNSETAVQIITAKDITLNKTAVYYPTTAGGETDTYAAASHIHKISVGAGQSETDTFVTTIRMNNLNLDQEANTNKHFVAKIVYSKTNCL